MAPTEVALCQRLSAANGWVFALLLTMATWRVPQEYIGDYGPMFVANDMPVSAVGDHLIGIAFLAFALASIASFVKDESARKSVVLAWGAYILLGMAYYMFWRLRTLWALNDEDKIVWLATGAYATLPIAGASLALIIWRFVQWRLVTMNAKAT